MLDASQSSSETECRGVNRKAPPVPSRRASEFRCFHQRKPWFIKAASYLLASIFGCDVVDHHGHNVGIVDKVAVQLFIRTNDIPPGSQRTSR